MPLLTRSFKLFWTVRYRRGKQPEKDLIQEDIYTPPDHRFSFIQTCVEYLHIQGLHHYKNKSRQLWWAYKSQETCTKNTQQSKTSRSRQPFHVQNSPCNLQRFSTINDLCAKLVVCLNTSIPARKSLTKLFGITQIKNKSTRPYMKRFSEKMFKVEELIELIKSYALISGVKEKTLWKELYALRDRWLLEVKQTMKNL